MRNALARAADVCWSPDLNTDVSIGGSKAMFFVELGMNSTSPSFVPTWYILLSCHQQQNGGSANF
jgi:hypothetical protein